MESASKKKKRGGQKKRKINLVFDPQARREFLTGFHKRKVERKAKFQENLKQMLRDERKRIKADAKESYKKMVVSHRSVPEIEHLLEEEHDLGTHSVEIKELSTTALAEQNNWIGANQMKYDVKEEASEGEDDKGDESDQSDSQLIPGMDLKLKVKKAAAAPEPKTESKSNELKSAKDIKRVIKLQATKQVKKSKVYQLKNKIEKMKQRKKSQQQKKRNEKVKESGKKGKRLKKMRGRQGD